MPNAYALDCNTSHRRKAFAVGAPHQKRSFGPGTRDVVSLLLWLPTDNPAILASAPVVASRKFKLEPLSIEPPPSPRI